MVSYRDFGSSNQIATFINKSNKVVVPSPGVSINIPGKSSDNSPALLATLLRNVEQLGFTLDNDVMEALKYVTPEDLQEFYNSLTVTLRDHVNCRGDGWEPMYPNFPTQLMEVGDAELYLNAIVHYTGAALGYRILPEYDKETRNSLPLFDQKPLQVLTLGSQQDFMGIFTSLLSSKTSLSESDRELVGWFVVEHTDQMKNYVPPAIPFKENLTHFVGLILSNGINPGAITNLMKTATDVLRLATAISDGDVSLATNTKFVKFKRSHRRFLLALIENAAKTSWLQEDMLRHQNKWKRLGEILHPGEYCTRYPKTFESFDAIRHGSKIATFNSVVEGCLLRKDQDTLLINLVRRPGEFARRLDHVLRLFRNKSKTIDAFRGVAGKVASPLLLSLANHFNNRNVSNDTRIFFPKGNVAKAQVIANNLPKLSYLTIKSVVSICNNELLSRLGDKSKLGLCWVDPRLKGYAVPLQERGANTSVKTLARGSWIPIDEGKETVRFFIHWMEGDGEMIDVDLSAVMYDENWKRIEHISYTNLRSDKYKAHHSGDLTSAPAPSGACEFIDLDMQSIEQYGGRYVVASVYSYSGQLFTDMEECFAGWMTRSNPNSGEIFDKCTVDHQVDLTSEQRVCIPAIIDVKERKILWVDLALASEASLYNVENTKKGINLLGKAMVQKVSPNLYDLFTLNARSRGTVVSTREDADFVFALDGDVTPFDAAKITSEYL